MTKYILQTDSNLRLIKSFKCKDGITQQEIDDYKNKANSLNRKQICIEDDNLFNSVISKYENDNSNEDESKRGYNTKFTINETNNTIDFI